MSPTRSPRDSARLGTPGVGRPTGPHGRAGRSRRSARAGQVSCGGSSRLLRSADGWIAAHHGPSDRLGAGGGSARSGPTGRTRGTGPPWRPAAATDAETVPPRRATLSVCPWPCSASVSRTVGDSEPAWTATGSNASPDPPAIADRPRSRSWWWPTSPPSGPGRWSAGCSHRAGAPGDQGRVAGAGPTGPDTGTPGSTPP